MGSGGRALYQVTGVLRVPPMAWGNGPGNTHAAN
jgi:hypothetical protein